MQQKTLNLNSHVYLQKHLNYIVDYLGERIQLYFKCYDEKREESRYDGLNLTELNFLKISFLLTESTVSSITTVCKYFQRKRPNSLTLLQKLGMDDTLV
ncbi:uncharacterized protein Gasu_26650 [Galdieria sulphuraria]|uniref:Uncharacterized protein n=1 Tax=Galdieria sulphuraria TaxID=130081 RepID=M2XIH2_GALSU|nr:uncharacterized protein Gasu_26650 [Galdieria sulphuraria]EME29877.1 hypothetical protein Gasu_26650 [Galdieria sulphuraria]|eukprot:XP_005706397.1 hypothetical protein Gasu_26650 [Galdieria sulphuraria]